MSQLTTRDYKGAGRRSSPPGGLKEFLLGALAGGLLAGFGTALVMHHARTPTAAAGAAAHAVAPPAVATPASVAGRGERGNAGKPELAQAGVHGTAGHARGKAAPAQPRYDFYQMLPNLKVTVPRPTAPGAQSVGANGRTQFAGYVLQVGSYRDEAQARRVIARLDGLGIIGHIDTVTDTSGTLHRVRIGPITEAAELNHIRGVLKAIGLPAMVIPGATH